MELDDTVYQFPFPISELLNCGWEIDSTEERSVSGSEQEKIEPKSSESVVLINKGERRLYCTVFNFSIKETTRFETRNHAVNNITRGVMIKRSLFKNFAKT